MKLRMKLQVHDTIFRWKSQVFSENYSKRNSLIFVNCNNLDNSPPPAEKSARRGKKSPSGHLFREADGRQLTFSR